ncbi:hypothetical protein SAMN05444358_103206 [Ruegeria halocynthiae]|uniref:Uncharacterized protein n=1 Tax=Ruegeria halocynthiae TaxID=985054 RepID=A0A1H2ZF35_9RHOB|nr:hypothetical protein [Ruegeria halocynthiae]SDX16103.1 hypothetical protein SAMN05444358_103206 [Ruegeria halocynthiae]
MTAPGAFMDAMFELPIGTFTGTAGTNQYVVSHQIMACGKSHKLVAHQLGGPDYISLNLYMTRKSGALLRPCEMPAEKVVTFVLTLAPDVQE